jgi:hypothetical protein
MRQETNAMRTMRGAGRPRERGSALILATLISVILSLLGISYLMMAQTENTIAENERNSALALYVAESGARVVVHWFNDPSSTTGYLVPATGDVDRSQRLLDHDFDISTARVVAVSGDTTRPIYKDAVAVPGSAILDRPYRSAGGTAEILGHGLWGIETGTDPDPLNAARGPDLVVSASHLATINNALFPNFPSADLRARIARIEVYAPPTILIGAVPTRMGIATIKVTGGVFIFPGTANERQIATRVAKAVINEIPVPGPTGPLQSCATLAYTGAFDIHWGTSSSVAAATIPTAADTKINTGMPYALNDPFTYISTPDTLATWATNHNGESIEDPWFKFIAGGAISGPALPNPGDPQPWHYVSPGSTTADHTNIFQNTVINCPSFDYNLWKSIAQGGMKNNHYYKYDGGGNFRLDGVGTPQSFVQATSGRTGVMFFDTTNAQPPNGLPYTDAGSNLTPDISISSASGWNGMAGFVYLNAKSFETTGAGSIGMTRTIFPPGEPGNTSTDFVNLNYPGSFALNHQIRHNTVNFETFQDPVTGDWFCTDAQQCDSVARIAAASPVRDKIGLPFQETVAMDGVLYISGVFKCQGNANFFGSLVAQQGVVDGAGTPNLYFDESLITGNWPRKGMNLPRVIISSWQTDL